MVDYIPWFIVIEKVLECECPLHWATYIFLMPSMSLSHGCWCSLTVGTDLFSQN